jgi:plastocyanin
MHDAECEVRITKATKIPMVSFVPSIVSFVSFVSFVSLTPSLASGARAAAASGVIHGHIELRHALSAPERRPNVSDLGAASRRDLPDRTRSVVYLETAPRGAFEQTETGRAVLDQRNETFVPHVLAITTGTTVEFPNSDRIYHNVFSLSKPASFDLGRYPMGHSKSVRFDKAGIVRVFCEIHSHMSAFILVFAHPFFALTDSDGRYRIDNVPPGNYAVIAWNEGASSDPAPVAVPSGGATDLDIALR